MIARPGGRGAVSWLVTADVTMVPDYYARLGVDPGAQRSEIDAAIKRLQPAWSMGTRNPKTRLKMRSTVVGARKVGGGFMEGV